MNSGSSKVIDIRIANIIAPIRVPERNTRSLNSDRSTAGTGAVSSRITNAASTNTATNAAAVITRDENQSLRLPSSRTYCSAASPTVISTIPTQSRFLRWAAARAWFSRRMSSGSCTKRVTMKMPSSPIGRLM